MKREDLQRLLRQRPFQPFRVLLRDGRTYEIKYPRMNLLAESFVKIGIHPGMAATWNLPRLVGPSHAADLLYTGRLVDAREALSMGLVNRIAGDDRFLATVAELARAIAANGPVAVRALKQTLRGSATRTIDDAIVREADAQAMTFKTSDAREGISAVKAKREPRFTGR